MNLGVNLSDYSVGAMHGGALYDTANVSPQELAELSKALDAGNGQQVYGQATPGSGTPLRVESLEQTLKVLTFKEQDIVFWKSINKAPAFNTVEEFNQLVSYGSGNGGFNNEGELPEEDSSTYRRMAEHVKFLGSTRSVSHPMTLVRSAPGVGNVVQKEIQNGTMDILRKANKGLAFGDASMVPQQWNGIYAQHRNSWGTVQQYADGGNVIDLRGAPITKAVLETASETIIENHGYADMLMGPPLIHSELIKSYLALNFGQVNFTNVDAQGKMGKAIKQVATQFGDVALGYDKFLKTEPAKTTSSLAESPKAPNVVTLGSTPVAAVTDATYGMFGSDGAGDYTYAIAAVNRYGESALTVLNPSTALTLTATQSADLSFNDGGGSYPATCYTVYRTKKNDTATGSARRFYPLFQVSTSQRANGYDNASANLVRDRNRVLPDTQQCFLYENTTDVFEFKQLAPLMKMDLALLSPSQRFMILLYGTPQLYAPGKVVKIVNAGRTA